MLQQQTHVTSAHKYNPYHSSISHPISFFNPTSTSHPLKAYPTHPSYTIRLDPTLSTGLKIPFYTLPPSPARRISLSLSSSSLNPFGQQKHGTFIHSQGVGVKVTKTHYFVNIFVRTHVWGLTQSINVSYCCTTSHLLYHLHTPSPPLLGHLGQF